MLIQTEFNKINLIIYFLKNLVLNLLKLYKFSIVVYIKMTVMKMLPAKIKEYISKPICEALAALTIK